jgi:hypothetical protein
VQRRRLIWGLALAGLTIVSAPGCDDFKYEKYVANLEGAQENPGVPTTAAGQAIVLVARDESRVDVTVTLTSPLQGTLTLSHIHKAPRGTNGSVIHNLWVPGRTATETFDVGFPLARTLTFTAENLADLRAGNYYVNVHSSRNPGGEIRGQLVRQD